MICVDVNVLVYAHRCDLAEHDRYRELLLEIANGSEPLGLADAVLSGFLRVITNRRVFKEPTPTPVALERIAHLIAAPAGLLLTPSPRHWRLFTELVNDIDARGNDVSDAYIAAYAVDNNATLLSADRGFARFDRVAWRHPLAS